jgi:hypothetical protein
MAKKSKRKRSPAVRSATKATTAKRKPAKRVKATAQPANLPALSGVAKELFTRVLNSIAFEQYGSCCAVDDLAEKLGKPSGRLQPAIRKLVEQGYVTVEGEIYPIVYPTAAALRHQNPRLSLQEAEAIVAKVRRG